MKSLQKTYNLAFPDFMFSLVFLASSLKEIECTLVHTTFTEIIQYFIRHHIFELTADISLFFFKKEKRCCSLGDKWIIG